MVRWVKNTIVPASRPSASGVPSSPPDEMITVPRQETFCFRAALPALNELMPGTTTRSRSASCSGSHPHGLKSEGSPLSAKATTFPSSTSLLIRALSWSSAWRARATRWRASSGVSPGIGRKDRPPRNCDEATSTTPGRTNGASSSFIQL